MLTHVIVQDMVERGLSVRYYRMLMKQQELEVVNKIANANVAEMAARLKQRQFELDLKKRQAEWAAAVDAAANPLEYTGIWLRRVREDLAVSILILVNGTGCCHIYAHTCVRKGCVAVEYRKYYCLFLCTCILVIH